MPNLLETAWTDLVLASFAVDPALLAPYAPPGTQIDTYCGAGYMSIVGFRWTAPRFLGVPAPFLGSFPEVNLRTYVRRPLDDGFRRGVVFIQEIVSRPLVASIARWGFGEPFVLRPLRQRVEADRAGSTVAYEWRAGGRGHRLAVRREGAPRPLAPGSHEAFLLDQCWAYGRDRRGGTVEYLVEHEPWRVWELGAGELDCDGGRCYGPAIGDALRGAPFALAAATGSAVRVRPGRRT